MFLYSHPLPPLKKKLIFKIMKMNAICEHFCLLFFFFLVQKNVIITPIKSMFLFYNFYITICHYQISPYLRILIHKETICFYKIKINHPSLTQVAVSVDITIIKNRIKKKSIKIDTIKYSLPKFT